MINNKKKTLLALAGALGLFTAVVPSLGQARDVQCVNGYDHFVCGDGTTMGCSSNGVQYDCDPNNQSWNDIADEFCADHGGLVGWEEGTPICYPVKKDR